MPDQPEVSAQSPTPERRWTVRRVLKYAVAVLAAFGIFGAIGGKLVNEYFDTTIESVRGDDPLIVAVGYDTHLYSDGYSAATQAVGQLDTQLAVAEDCLSLLSAARAAGAADVQENFIHMVLEGRTVRSVTIVGLRAVVEKRGKPFSGASVACQSAGGVDAIGFSFNLDEPEPVARMINQDGTPGEPYFSSGVITFTKGEIVPFNIVARTDKSYVEWRMEADLVIDGKRETVVIDENGRPFKVSASLPEGQGYKRYYEWQWYEQPQGLYKGDVPATG